MSFNTKLSQLAARFLPSSAAKLLGMDASGNVATFDVATATKNSSSNTTLATTEFVRLNGVRFGEMVSITSTPHTINATDTGKIFIVNTAGATVINLPKASDVPIGSTFHIWIHSLNPSTVTFNVAGGTNDKILAGTLVTSYAIRNTGMLTIVSEGPSNESHWEFSGTAVLESLSSFGSVAALPGYQKLPSGIIIQWGSASSNANSTTTVTFPIAFPNAAFSVTGNHAGGGGAMMIVGTVTRTNFLCAFTNRVDALGTSTLGGYWMAIGH